MFFNDSHCAPELNLRDPAANAPTLNLVADTTSVTITPPASVKSISVIDLPCFRAIPEADVQRSKGTRRVRNLESARFSFEERVRMPLTLPSLSLRRLVPDTHRLVLRARLR